MAVVLPASRWHALAGFAMLAGLFFGGCGGQSVSRDDRGAGGRGADAGNGAGNDAGAAAGEGGSAGGEVRPPGGPYELCGSPENCVEGLYWSTWGNTCVCTPNCADEEAYDYEASSCPEPPPGLTAAYCDPFHRCVLPCTSYASSFECPSGLACGVSPWGLRCITSPEALAAGNPPRSVVAEFELYGACETFSENGCSDDPTSAGRHELRVEECWCTRHCFSDDQCPASPMGYGAPTCLDATERYAGFCALTCDAETPTCPDHMRCAPATEDETTLAVSVCRGGIYRHGDGDDVIEAGEVYGSSADGCDPGLGTTTAGGGRCVDTRCESDADCPAPPPGYSTPVCEWTGTCWLSCETVGSTEECLDGLECQDIGPASMPNVTLLACQ